jgi:hypothetical protein
VSGGKPLSWLLDLPQLKLSDPFVLPLATPQLKLLDLAPATSLPLIGSTQPVTSSFDYGLKSMQGLPEDLARNLLAKEQALQAEVQALRAEVQAQQAALARERVPPKKGNRAGTMAPATRALFRAAGAVLYGENRKKIPRTQRDLANLIVECAYDLGLAPDDMLNANEKNVLVAAQELLAGMRAADLDADS